MSQGTLISPCEWPQQDGNVFSLHFNLQTASVRGFTKQVLGSLISGADVKEGAQKLLNATHLQQVAPRTVVAFLGSHIPTSGDVNAQQGLQGFLDAATSSLALPNVLHKVSSPHPSRCSDIENTIAQQLAAVLPANSSERQHHIKLSRTMMIYEPQPP